MRFSAIPFIAAITLLPFTSLAEVTRICNIEIEASEEIDFSDTEESWLCGDPDTQAWKTIPLSQQRQFLESFLQSRGFHNAKTTAVGGLLKVQAGEPAVVRAFTVVGAPVEWNWAKKWDLFGNTLNPETLDEAGSWAKRELQQRGFSCPEISPLAFLDSGEIRLNLKPGEPFRFGDIETVGNSELDPAILERFSAYRKGQMYDKRLLELTATRILQEDLYLSTYFDVICAQDEPVRVVRRSVPALPRLFTIGAGFDTERGPLARARFRWARIGPAANSLEATIFAAIREQTFETRFNYFFLNDLSSRVRLIPFLSIRRLLEEKFTSVTTQVGARLANSWEQESFQFYAEAGPLAERANTTKGLGPKKVDAIKFITKLTTTSHLYEYYLTDPRHGWMANLETTSQFGGALAEETVQRILLQHQILWNLGSWEPPLLILGWRSLMGTYFLSNRNVAASAVPVEQRFFLGGDENIRGFSRKEIPGHEDGFLTSIYQGFELRTGGWFPWNIQPFIFFDWAKGGTEAKRLARSNYYAPGLGVRWSSPIGTIRSTLGHGFIGNRTPSDPEGHLQFFFSFGKEF